MKKLIYFSAIIFFISASTFAQTYIYKSSIGKFKTATSFDINAAGFVFVADAGTDEIYKLDTLGHTLNDAGGYGWNNGNFDYPSDIFATPLNVYVCDKNNHRVERFDKNLNFISLLYTRNSDTSGERFGYPLCAATSQLGDLYILDSENKRIVKFDLFGNYISNFGGYDAGAYALSDPVKFAISNNNNIYVLDTKRIVVFDQYGNGLFILNEKLNYTGIHIIFNLMTLNTKDEIYFENLSSSGRKIVKLNIMERPDNEDIVSSLIFGDNLYILTNKQIEIFKKLK